MDVEAYLQRNAYLSCLISVHSCETAGQYHLQNPGRKFTSMASRKCCLFSFSVEVFITQSTANRKRNGDNKHPCHTPVFI